MRLWLKDSERKPDPAPVTSDDRKAMVVGIALWVVALAVMLIFIVPLTESGNGWWVWACAAGLVLGLAGLLYTHRRHRV